METGAENSAAMTAATVRLPASPILSGPKRQHFLPRFYLDGFSRDGLVAVYDRETGKILLQAPQNTAVIGHFYTFEDMEGRRRFDLEALLSEFEGKAAPVLAKLVRRDVISPDEASDLAIFISLGAFRTPDIVESLKLFRAGVIGDLAKRSFADVDQVKNRLRKTRGTDLTEEELEREARELVEFAQSDRYDVTIDHSWAVGQAFRLGFAVAPILAGRRWTVLHRADETLSFVTTDAPVVLGTLEAKRAGAFGVGFGSPDAVVAFPLTQGSCLLLHGSGGNIEHRTVGRTELRSINLKIADSCRRYVIGRDEALVRSLATNLHLESKSWRPKMQRA